MRYTTRQIVDRALALTDFNDDFFVGNREMEQLLNDAYMELYATLANKNDKTYLNTITVHNGEELPANIYKINELTHMNNPLQKTQDYDIQNNRIILYNSLPSALLKFYPEPHRLTLKPNTVKEMSVEGAVSSWTDGYIQNGKVIDENNNQLFSFPVNSIHLSNGYIDSSVHLYNGTQIQDIALIRGNTITYDKVVISSSVSNLIAVITNETQSFHYLLDNQRTLYTMDGKIIDNLSTTKTMFCKEDGLYIVRDSQLIRILGEVQEAMNDGIYSAVGILDEYEAVYQLGDKFFSRGYGTDSVLDNPNAVFWSYLGYVIAEAICSVVQRPSENISKRRAELSATFLNSLQIDDNSVYQIRNIDNWSRQIW